MSPLTSNSLVDRLNSAYIMERADAAREGALEVERLRSRVSSLENALRQVRRIKCTDLLTLAELGILVSRALHPGSGPLPPDYTLETGGSHSERYRVALQKIIDDGDYTAPEGMKLIAREALANGTGESRAALDVLAERRRQVTVEGWTPEHDDQHNDSELAEAAVAYASHAASRGWSFADSPDEYRNDRPFPPERAVFGYGDVTWPKHWSWDWWKPTSPRRDLVKAAALILAEIERLDRHSQKAFEQCFALVQRTTFPCTLAKGHSGPHEYSQSAEKPR